MAIRAAAVTSYFEELRPSRDAVMTSMEDLATRDDVPIVSWETGRLLASLAGALDGRILEVGTAIGYSALHMAQALPADGNGHITTLERDPDRIAQARRFWERAGVADRVEIVDGDAEESLRGLHGPFDMLFLDGTKSEYRTYLELAEPLLSPRALLVVDNVLMSGQVAAPDEGGRWSAEAVQGQAAFNHELVHGEDWLASVLPVGDGVLVASRRPRRKGGEAPEER